MTLTKEEIKTYTIAQTELALKKFHKTWNIDQELTPELLRQVDDIANTMLWLEDHLAHARQAILAQQASAIRWANVAEKSQLD